MIYFHISLNNQKRLYLVNLPFLELAQLHTAEMVLNMVEMPAPMLLQLLLYGIRQRFHILLPGHPLAFHDFLFELKEV
jgi:hypothetical protein